MKDLSVIVAILFECPTEMALVSCTTVDSTECLFAEWWCDVVFR